MPTTHAFSAAIATFAGVWCIFLSSLTPLRAVERAIRRPDASATGPRRLERRALPSVLVTPRARSAPVFDKAAPVAEPPLAKAPPRLRVAAARHER